MPQSDKKCTDWIRRQENIFIFNISPHNLSVETYLQSVHAKHSNIIFQSLVTRNSLKSYLGGGNVILFHKIARFSAVL